MVFVSLRPSCSSCLSFGPAQREEITASSSSRPYPLSHPSSSPVTIQPLHGFPLSLTSSSPSCSSCSCSLSCPSVGFKQSKAIAACQADHILLSPLSSSRCRLFSGYLFRLIIVIIILRWICTERSNYSINFKRIISCYSPSLPPSPILISFLVLVLASLQDLNREKQLQHQRQADHIQSSDKAVAEMKEQMQGKEEIEPMKEEIKESRRTNTESGYNAG